MNAPHTADRMLLLMRALLAREDRPAMEPPGWLRRLEEVRSGKKTWEDYSFAEKTDRGWLVQYLLLTEITVYRENSRWAWWLAALQNRALPETPIPEIRFLDGPSPAALAILDRCFKPMIRHGARIRDFLEWLLWGFGGVKEKPPVAAELNEHWYRNFDLGHLIESPFDYLGHILADEKKGYWNNPHAFFPTPMPVVRCMVQMTMHDDPEMKLKTVNDPCTGTGRFLLEASNHSLFLSGMDIDPTVILAAKINGWLYVPWLVVNPFLPERDKGLSTPPSPAGALDISPDPPPEAALSPERKKPESPGTAGKPVQLSLFE